MTIIQWTSEVYCIKYQSVWNLDPPPAGHSAFDPDEALGQALRVFRQKGYDGASLSDLTGAMGINRPSLYGAFGNKQALFRAALARWSEAPARHVEAALAAASARLVAEQVLRRAADLYTAPGEPGGCLEVRGAHSCSDEESAALRADFAARRGALEVDLRLRFARAVSEGDLPVDADPQGLALFVCTLLNGMAVQATNGAGRADLHKVVDAAMERWPG